MIYVIDIIKATHSSQVCGPIGTAETKRVDPRKNRARECVALAFSAGLST